MVVGQAVIASDGDMLLNAGMELIPSFITSLHQRGYTSLVIDDDATKGITVAQTISSEIRAAATRQLRGTFSAFGRASADLKGKSTSQIEKGLGSQTFADQAKEIDPHAAMIESIQGMIDDLLTADALDGLNAVKIHDDQTFEHSINVAATTLMIGKQLRLDQRQLRMLGLGALLHDVGKMFVDKEIIQKPGKLTSAEWAKMAAHPRMGYMMLRESGSPHDLLAHHVAYQHHEHQAGSGYPRGLTGTNKLSRRGRSHEEGHHILPLAEITTVANVYDAIVPPRPHRPAYPHEQVPEILAQLAGTVLNTAVVTAFDAVLPLVPTGVAIEVISGEYRGYQGVVARVDRTHLKRPWIRLMHDAVGRPIEIDDIDLLEREDLAIRSLISPFPQGVAA